ncbi:flagellar hook protein FlgE [Vibrio furnissii]|uniref:flagellar hook protein FlgE n=1 Tax=Vibrio furnissii TaxID=29494 RepID=UPI001E619813|nr:flagellar hook protein FlgE [Vibrio furnissii]MCG6266318.1 flagellar basal body protein FlgE [Vibrio furnissii]UHJ61292.1 flagellar basal body protein FlgE [Vibrio furnissii]
MSFNIALSGLNASNQELNTISNNIANVSTTGFKESRTEFGSVYNGQQAGGVQVMGISQNFEATGSMSATGRSLDMALTGSGFFVVQDKNGQLSYTRSGVFGLDSQGNVISNTGGSLQGYTVDGNNNLLAGSMGPLKVDMSSLEAKATNKVDFAANLDDRVDAIDTKENPFDPKNVDSYNNSYTTPVYDSKGNEHTLTQYFVKTGDNTWEIHSIVDGVTSTLTTTPATFDSKGNLTSATAYTISASAAGADTLNITVDMTNLSQYGSDFVVSKNNPNGYTSGSFTDIRVEANGMVYATYSNGQSLLQGQLVLANFNAPQELMQTSNTAWTQTYGSGQPVYGIPGSGQFGELASGVLEGSNVDLTSELVHLMSAQRNYQANTKTITTADQLMMSLFNAV